jgi:Uma2 family endonuclease
MVYFPAQKTRRLLFGSRIERQDMSLKTSLREQSTLPNAVAPDWSLGWRYERVRRADGREEEVRIPLTPAEALHPKEGYIMPVRTFHDRLTDDLCYMLRAHCEQQPDVVVFHDLVFTWDQPAVGDYAPDIAVVRNVRDRDADRGTFVVALEGTRPSLIIEITSPSTRETDRVKKVKDYALVGVEEYIYIDHTTRRGKEIWEIAGFRLDGDRYLPMLPDEDGAYFCETVGLRIGLEDGRVWLEDANTGEELLTAQQVSAARDAEVARANAEAARAAAEAERANAEAARANAEAEARKAAEARAAELEAIIAALQQKA